MSTPCACVHRAPHIRPLYRLQHKLSSRPFNPGATFDISDMLGMRPVAARPNRGTVHRAVALKRTAHPFREMYVGRVGSEYMRSPSETERL